jgi:putative phosphoesterase
MKFGILSDIHGNYVALSAVLAEFRRQNVTDLLFLGDLVGYYPFARECVSMLTAFSVTSVRGNHDHIALNCLEAGTHTDEHYRRAYGSALDRTLDQKDAATAAFLRDMPLVRRMKIENRILRLCHGSPWDALEGRVYPDFEEWERFKPLETDVVLLGHTHYPVQRQCGAVLVINPGSVGQARQRSAVACAAMLDVPSLTTSMIEISYDPAPLIMDARAHNPDLPYLVQVLQR